MTFHENLRKARLARGLTQEALGEKLGMAAQTVSKWERGESLPDAALLPPLADLLGVSLDRLFARKTGTYEDAAAAVEGCLRSLDMEDRWDAALRLGNVMSLSASGLLEKPELPDSVREYALSDREASGGYMHSQGFSVYTRRKRENLSVFTLFPRPEAGWEAVIGQDKPALWEDLANGEVRRVLRTLYGAMGECDWIDRSYADRLLSSLSPTDPEGVLAALERLEVLKRRRICLDDRETDVFILYRHVDLLQLLLLGNAGPWGSVAFGVKKEEEGDHMPRESAEEGTGE